MDNDAISESAEGTNDVVDRIITLTKIHVRYTLRLPDGAPREKVDRALETHVSKCPTAQSIKDSVEITWSAVSRTSACKRPRLCPVGPARHF